MTIREREKRYKIEIDKPLFRDMIKKLYMNFVEAHAILCYARTKNMTHKANIAMNKAIRHMCAPPYDDMYDLLHMNDIGNIETAKFVIETKRIQEKAKRSDRRRDFLLVIPNSPSMCMSILWNMEFVMDHTDLQDFFDIATRIHAIVGEEVG